MAGIYIHIPFCKQACHYCNFHFSLSLKRKNELIDALLLEMDSRKAYLQNQSIETIYIGGGTPSLLNYEDLAKIKDKIFESFHINEIKEFTLEANPDDLDQTKINDIKRVGINRLSIGVQSFNDEDLRYMNRAHNATDAISSIYRSQDSGLENISIDLIYGTPTMSDKQWTKNIEMALSTQVPHISSYALTVEPSTKLASLIGKKMMAVPTEESAASQFNLLLEQLEKNDFEQYEISNFCKNSNYAMHNTAYWKGAFYLGIGPSAHSYDGQSRSWNISNNNKYIQLVNDQQLHFETEQLSLSNKVNEYIMTSLRTKWGLDLNQIKTQFNAEIMHSIVRSLQQAVEDEFYFQENNIIYLSKKGKLMADGIASKLFIE